MMEHTETPWEQSDACLDGEDRPVIRRDGALIAVMYQGAYEMEDGTDVPIPPEELEANAAFIVRACNAHEELLTACESALHMVMATVYGDCFDSTPDNDPVVRQLRDALRKAKEA